MASQTRNLQPFVVALNRYVQVLVESFTLDRKGRGAHLDIKLHPENLMLWSSSGKTDLRHQLEELPDFQEKRKRYQSELDDFLLEGKDDSYRFSDPGYPFRYASGGTLPIVRVEGMGDYYCLIYREVPPIGWNIANGSCDTISELLNPLVAIERELREELIAFDMKRRYVYSNDEGKSVDHAEFAAARRAIQDHLKLGLEQLEETVIPLKWLEGPDSLTVEIVNYKGAVQRNEIDGCFLNINAEDWGIEVDRVAHIRFAGDVILFDGEIGDGYLVNSPVGLFSVERFESDFDNGSNEFCPDVFFFDACRYSPPAESHTRAATIRRVINENFLPGARKHFLADEETIYQKACDEGVDLDLCPVTRRIVHRYINNRPKAASIHPPAHESDSPLPEIFISYASEDSNLAARVAYYLRLHSKKDVFFADSPESLAVGTEWSSVIDAAISRTTTMVVVATKLEHVNKNHVQYEWRSFHDIRNVDKTRLIHFVNFDRKTLPLPLRRDQGIQIQRGNEEAALRQLAETILA